MYHGAPSEVLDESETRYFQIAFFDCFASRQGGRIEVEFGAGNLNGVVYIREAAQMTEVKVQTARRILGVLQHREKEVAHYIEERSDGV